MSKREWKDSVAISYLYVAFAGITDNKIDIDEMNEIIKSMRFWFDESVSDDEINESIQTAFKRCVLEDSLTEGVEKVNGVVTDLAIWLSDDFFTRRAEKFNYSADEVAKDKRHFLSDLVRIARADNNFHENEQSWIDIIAGIIGVEFNV